MNIKKILIASLYLFSAYPTFAEEHKITAEFKEKVQNSVEIQDFHDFNLLLDKKQTLNADNNSCLSLDINALAFARNTEYFMPFTKGYTALGFMFDPSLKYQINEKASLNAGIHTIGIAGEDGLKRISPIFRLEYMPANWIRIVGGSLYGNLNHKMSEQMYNFERFFYKNDEMGLQVIADSDHWDGDIWCDWEDFIEIDDDKQERFVFGWHNKFTLTDSKKNFKMVECTFPLDFMAAHRGGQITSLQDTCIETLFNAMVGLNVSINTPNLFVKKSTLSVEAFGFKNNSNEEHIHTHYKDGWGIYPNIAIQNMQWKVQAGYWHAHRFISSRGSYLYQSRSFFDDTFTQEDRNMLTAKIFFEHHFGDLGIGFDGQLFYDTDLSKTDFAFGIYMKFADNFKLLKAKK